MELFNAKVKNGKFIIVFFDQKNFTGLKTKNGNRLASPVVGPYVAEPEKDDGPELILDEYHTVRMIRGN